MVQAWRRQNELDLGLEESRMENGEAPDMRQQQEQIVLPCHNAGRDGENIQFFWQREGRRKATESAGLGDREVTGNSQPPLQSFKVRRVKFRNAIVWRGRRQC